MRLKRIAVLLGFALGGYLSVPTEYSYAGYIEPGRIGSPESWQTPEFNAQWGLGAISAEYAYARGYTGKGVTIGIIDYEVYKHPEFGNKLSTVGDATYNYVVNSRNEFTFGDHGTHVSGTAMASRDGNTLHGVAFDAATISAKEVDFADNNGWEALIQSNARVINNSWGYPPDIRKDDRGNNIRLPNGTWDYLLQTPAGEINKALAAAGSLKNASDRPVPGSWDDTTAPFLRAAFHDKLIVSSTGNFNNYNVPEWQKSLPYAFPELLNNFLNVANLTQSDELHISSTQCGQTASFCVSAPGTDIPSSVARLVSDTGGPINAQTLQNGELSLRSGYKTYTGTSMAAPHVTGAAAVLMQRFPYMSADQIAAVLKTTATDLGAPGIDNLYGWGKIDLRRAIDGPMMFVTREDIPAEFYVPGSLTQTQFVANIPGQGATAEPGTAVARACTSPECAFDAWRNDIAGHGGLTKTGIGVLALEGKNTYSGPTIVQQGGLVVNGSLASAVTVESGGTLSGSGAVQSFRARGRVAPGNSIGTLRVNGDAVFEPGSNYRVEVAPGGRSDRIEAGRAVLNGGGVSLSLENSGNLLSYREARSLLGEKYTIITTQNGVSGRFDGASPAYPFIRPRLSYGDRDVGLIIARSSDTFDSLVQAKDDKAVARAAEALGAGNPVYESFLGLTSARQVREATRQLSGQIHADVAASQLNESRTLRDTATERLRQAAGSRVASGIKADESGAWAKLLGNWGHASGSGGAAGYQSSTYGVLLGVDNAVADRARLGVMTGYTRTSLDGAHRSDADSDNWHLGVYGDGRADGFALRGGGGVTWHQIDASRRVAYGAQSDHDKDKYSAHTGQLFAEGAWTWRSDVGSVEPFANLAWAEYRSGRIREKGGAAALRGGKQGVSATTSTLGLRGDAQWAVAQAAVSLRAELGWQRQLDGRRRDVRLAFRDGGAGFNVNSVRASRDAAVMKAGLEVAVSDGAALSLGYGGLLSKRYQDNGVNAGFTWRF